MHGVPVLVPGDINQTQKSAMPMVCLAYQTAHHHTSDCPGPVQAHIHQDNLVTSRTNTAAISPKKCLLGSLIRVGCAFFGSLRLRCRRTALSLGLGFTRCPEGLASQSASMHVFFPPPNMTHQVISQQLHDECRILVALFA